MKIALVQDHLRMGGTERQSVALANAFSAAGHEVLLLTFRTGGPLTTAVDRKVLRIALQGHDLGLDWYSPGMVRVLCGFAPDVVQFMGRMANCQGWRARYALPRTRFVATFRTGKDIPWLYRTTMRRADAVVANSDEAARRLEQSHGIAREKICVVRNAVAAPTPAPSGTRETIRREVGTPPDALVFLCVAMMRRGKGHAKLVEAASHLAIERPWELWLAGDGSELTRCIEIARRTGASKHVRFLGLRRNVASLYAAADVAVLASRLESLPNFLVEAQWSGLPVVACDVAGVGETFAPGASGILVPLDDTAALRAALERVAHDDDFRSRAAIVARDFARERFDPEQQNRSYLELYAKLVENRTRP